MPYKTLYESIKETEINRLASNEPMGDHLIQELIAVLRTTAITSGIMTFGVDYLDDVSGFLKGPDPLDHDFYLRFVEEFQRKRIAETINKTAISSYKSFVKRNLRQNHYYVVSGHETRIVINENNDLMSVIYNKGCKDIPDYMLEVFASIISRHNNYDRDMAGILIHREISSEEKFNTSKPRFTMPYWSPLVEDVDPLGVSPIYDRMKYLTDKIVYNRGSTEDAFSVILADFD